MKAEALADEELVARCQGGDGAAWRALVHRYQSLVYTVPRRARLSDAAAADVFQTTFTRLFEHIERLTDRARVRAWLVTTARRETLRQLQAGQREGMPGEQSVDELAASDRPWDEAARESNDEERWQVARIAVVRLAPRCRRLIELLFLTEPEPSYAEIGRELNMPVGSIGPTRLRCLAQLRKLMGSIDDGIFD